MRQTTKHGTKTCKQSSEGKECGDLSLNWKRDIRPILINKKNGMTRLTKLVDRSPLELRQCILFQEFADNPIKIWTTLEVVHIQKCPGTLFNAYNDFFSIRKNESESLQTLRARIKRAMSKMQNLFPHGFNLQKLDEEVCMEMI